MSRIVTNASKVLHREITKIGPYRANAEAEWIVNMLEDPNDKNHSGLSYCYTKEITNTIITNGLINWKNNYIHLTYDDMFKIFYCKGFVKLGTDLITTPFDNQLITKFNEQYKLDNYEIKEPVLHLLPLLKIIQENNPELK
jgi:hypothetical protein